MPQIYIACWNYTNYFFKKMLCLQSIMSLSPHNPAALVVEAKSLEDLQDAQWVRKQVFVYEQGVPLNLEIDGKDLESDVFLLLNIANPNIKEIVGTCRCRRVGKSVKIERFAVLPQFRLKGFGILLMQYVLKQYAKEHLILNAQEQVVAYYQKLGFEVCSQKFYEAGIAHYAMQYKG